MLYFILIILFAYFYVMIQYNPIEMANNLRQNNGTIPGIRPGRPTSDFISKILSRLTLIGALFLAFIALLPIIYSNVTGMHDLMLGGTSIIILVGVALETSKQIESQMMMRHYKASSIKRGRRKGARTMKNLILLGAPGAGKGTQAEQICKHFSIPAISTGEHHPRSAEKRHGDGAQGKAYTEAGRLVPDDVVIGIIRERLAMDDCQNGFILDGFREPSPGRGAGRHGRSDRQGHRYRCAGRFHRQTHVRPPCLRSVAAPPTTCCTSGRRWRANATSVQAPLFSARATTRTRSRHALPCTTEQTERSRPITRSRGSSSPSTAGAILLEITAQIIAAVEAADDRDQDPPGAGNHAPGDKDFCAGTEDRPGRRLSPA